jgi:phage gpG-like protein
VLGGAVNLNGVTVSGNKMIQRGGGIYLNGNVDATINNLYVYNNEGTVVGANTAGAGIYISMTKPLAIGNAVISSNEARNGGGIYIQSGNVTLVDSSIVGNAAELRGGGILADGDGLTIERSTISGNGAKNGAGVTLNTTTGAPSTNTVSIKDTTIAGNIGSTSASSLLVYTGTTVSLNSVILSSGDVRRTNCEIEGGVVTDGGRVLSTDATCQLTSSTSITNTNVPVGALINYGGQVGASYQRGQQQAQLPLPYSSRGACTVNTTDRTIVCDIGAVKATYRSNFLPITIKP